MCVVIFKASWCILSCLPYFLVYLNKILILSDPTRNEPQGRIKTHLVEDVHYKVSISGRKEWEDGFGSKQVIWVSDGSKTKDGVGASCCGQRFKGECGLRLDSCNTVFQADVLAIKKCARTLSGRGFRGKVRSICTDGRAALKVLEGLVTGDKSNPTVAWRNKPNLVYDWVTPVGRVMRK